MSRLPAFAFALALVPALALADIAGPARVIDGDTLEVHGERIRLHGLDAPESRQLCRLDGEPWRCGQDATNALAGMIASRAVACQELDRDRHGRMVAKCSVAGADLGEWMVANGWAVAYVYFSYEYSRAEQRAKSARRGIWASEFVLPWEWRKGKRLDQPAGVSKGRMAPPSATGQSPVVACCKVCRKGKACGNSCIRRSYTCRKPPGCACNAN